ncbi:Rab-like protein 2A [Polyplax serrata]|uniref:Rab-like protein 2A n=1 Tax=Polyplax serrata TaxID=468196 RepID=A0AAN8SIT9_POLSC
MEDTERVKISDGHTSEKKKSHVKVICLGDSAVGKSKLVERFLLDNYKPQQLSTYALQLFRYETYLDKEPVTVEFWDTAGQDTFKSMHPSYYHGAHCCILVFDATRKVTYKNLPNWLKELREFRPNIPVLCAANKIDANAEATQKSYAFPQKNNLPFYYVSASDGTNVVRLFKDAIEAAVDSKKNSTDITDQIIEELERF